MNASSGTMKACAIRVLIIDDNQAFLNAIVTFLQMQDDIWIVGTMRETYQALKQVAELQPDVILLDLSMPGLSGLEAIPFFRATVPDVSIVILTFQDKTFYQPVALVAGASAFVSKFELMTDLLPTIRQVVQQR